MEDRIIRYLEGEATAADKQALEAWLKESAENERMFRSYYDAWSLSHQLHVDPQAAWKKLKRAKSSSLRRKRYVWWAAAACAVVVAGMAWMFNYSDAPRKGIKELAARYHPATQGEDILLVLSDERQIEVKDKKETMVSYSGHALHVDHQPVADTPDAMAVNQLIIPYGKRGTVVLEEGTKVWLNAHSRLVYPVRFEKGRREVYVEGEAYLEVSRDEKRPFIVRTDRLHVQVLGTHFAISDYPGEAQSQVVLVSGAVRVGMEAARDRSVVLSPREKYALSAEGEASIAPVPDTDVYTSWTRGIYQFEHTSLTSLAKLLERFYGCRIRLDTSIGALTCSGKLRLNEHCRQVLDGFAETLPIRIEEQTDNTYYITAIPE